ncbi:TIGR03862 family flavoprotein [Methyloversatilis thermotolerans]|uniref:TIGR03862 family flavoprotein n=1 Tax=Methyloversatilis thermotolerans TaxID=1346290 RepID=UPI0004769BA5|nr:TIGR03862 family flavoprotein [Methyloversatilis thermotolerans]
MKDIRSDVVAVIGGGPAGLMAAEYLSAAGASVDLFEGKPSVGRKFLLAGKGGLNLTHAEPRPAFDDRYRERSAELARWLDEFDGEAVRAWCHGLGLDTFVGTSGRVFPRDMKAAPLLRAWLSRLRRQGVRIHVRHRWTGWTQDGALRFETPAGEACMDARATLLALGGASWPQLGSDGRWVDTLNAWADIAPLRAANCGFDVPWSPHLVDRHAGAPLKTVTLGLVDAHGQSISRRGECVIGEHGLEGSLIYALSADIRRVIEARGRCAVHIDLLPDRDFARVLHEIEHPRGSRSMSAHLSSRLGLDATKRALLNEVLDRTRLADSPYVAATIKALPLTLLHPRPMAEAISTAGGVRLESLDAGLMLKSRPGVFCAGEMLDWEAPTGGYLLTACMASGRVAARAMQAWLRGDQPA